MTKAKQTTTKRRPKKEPIAPTKYRIAGREYDLTSVCPLKAGSWNRLYDDHKIDVVKLREEGDFNTGILYKIAREALRQADPDNADDDVKQLSLVETIQIATLAMTGADAELPEH